jgi:protein-S-isoprenylcysteine O-methyltransferase Ste14
MSDLEPNADDRSETGSRAFKKFVQRFRVTAGFALAPLLLIAARPTQLSLTVGAIIAITGIAIRAWASGYLKKNQELTVSGPYAYTRNPLYFGTFILGTGVAIASGALWFTILFVVLYLLIYVPVMSAEAETMYDLFPDDYENYSQKVPLFLPQLTAYSKPGEYEKTDVDERGFDLSLYLRYREYRAAIGCALVFLFMIVKMMFQ